MRILPPNNVMNSIPLGGPYGGGKNRACYGNRTRPLFVEVSVSSFPQTLQGEGGDIPWTKRSAADTPYR